MLFTLSIFSKVSALRGVNPLIASPATLESQEGHPAATCSPWTWLGGLLNLGFGFEDRLLSPLALVLLLHYLFISLLIFTFFLFLHLKLFISFTSFFFSHFCLPKLGSLELAFAQSSFWRFMIRVFGGERDFGGWLDGEKLRENVIGTLLNIQGKTKDGLNTRQDLVDMGIWSQLHPRSDGKKIYLPQACHTLSKKEKKSFC